jgi:hypothetical protein
VPAPYGPGPCHVPVTVIIPPSTAIPLAVDNVIDVAVVVPVPLLNVARKVGELLDTATGALRIDGLNLANKAIEFVLIALAIVPALTYF